MAEPLPPCRTCRGALQRIETMPGHVVCGSGHIWLEKDAQGEIATDPDDCDHLERVGEPEARRPPDDAPSSVLPGI